MTKTRVYGRAVVGLGVCMALLASCGGDGSSEAEGTAAEASGEAGSITVASPAPNSLFTYNEVVTRELDFYEDENLEVELVALGASVSTAGLLESGSADTALISATDTLAAAAKSDRFRLLYDERTGGLDFIFGVVVPTESGVTDLTELRGENIGLVSAAEGKAILASALEQVDMTLDDVTTTVVGPGGPAVAEALRTGSIAAYTGTLSDFAAFGEAGLEVENIIPEGLEGLPVGGYVTTVETLEEANDDLVKFLRALAKGTYAALERPELTELVTMEVAPENWREPEVARFLLEGLSQTLVPFDGETFGELKPDRWTSAEELLTEVGAIDGDVDIDSLLHGDMIEQINDWDRDEVLARADAWLAENRSS